MTQSVYKIITLVGTSKESWEKAVITAGGWRTRFLPITKSQLNEIL